MREYRRRNREKLNDYQRRYLADPEHQKRHKEACDDWRKNRMSSATREKIREYQRRYYRARKNGKDIEYD